MDPIADYMGGDSLGTCHHLTIDHQYPIMFAGDVSLHQYLFAILLGNVEGVSNMRLVPEVEGNPLPTKFGLMPPITIH